MLEPLLHLVLLLLLYLGFRLPVWFLLNEMRASLSRVLDKKIFNLVYMGIGQKKVSNWCSVRVLCLDATCSEGD